MGQGKKGCTCSYPHLAAFLLAADHVPEAWKQKKKSFCRFKLEARYNSV
jgi:hypothetical protein